MIRRLIAPAAVAGVLVLVLVALAGSAAAQTPSGPAGTSTPTTPPPAEARLAIKVPSGIVDQHVRWFLTGDKLLVKGKIYPYVAGQKVVIELHKSSGELVGQHTVKVEKGEGTAGKFQHRFRIKDDGRYFVVAQHHVTTEQKAGTSGKQKFRSIPGRVTGYESTRLLQIALNRLAYVSPVNGHLDEATRRAVLAFRKVNWYHHTGSPTPTVFRKVFNGRGGFVLRYQHPSMHVEGDLSRQVLVLADNGHPVQIYTMSSGKPSTPTVRGKFRFYRRQPGTNAHGMVWSVYFHGGYAVHGYPSVPPTYPASHGCIRVPIPDSHRIYSSVRLGETIFVFK